MFQVGLLSAAVLYLWGSWIGNSQVAPQEPIAAPLATILLEPYLGAQAIVHAVVNGQPGTFLFDTGEGVSSFSPAFAKKIGCQPWGRISGFRMSGERLDNQHCDGITFQLSKQALTAPVVSTVDIMTFLGLTSRQLTVR